MSDSVEFKTIDRCMHDLETGLAAPGIERKLVHFLKKEGFINDEVRDKVLGIRLEEMEKAGELAKRIKNRVKQDRASFNLFVCHLEEYDKLYQPLLSQLQEEYKQQKAQGKLSGHTARAFHACTCSKHPIS